MHYISIIWLLLQTLLNMYPKATLSTDKLEMCYRKLTTKLICSVTIKCFSRQIFYSGCLFFISTLNTVMCFLMLISSSPRTSSKQLSCWTNDQLYKLFQNGNSNKSILSEHSTENIHLSTSK